jgi:hypothetical protein
MAKQDQRRFHRIPFDASVTLLGSMPGQQWQANLLDISLKGALLEKPRGWNGNIGDMFHLDMHLDGGDPSIKLAMDARVTHIEDNHVGFVCEKMDIDTATHLHRLVELNLGDESLLERELAQLVATKSV